MGKNRRLESEGLFDSFGCQVLLCAEAAGHKEADCGTPGGSGSSAAFLVSRVSVQETPGLLPAHWWVRPGPRASARFLEDRARSWSPVAGPRSPRACVGSQLGTASWTAGSGVS